MKTNTNGRGAWPLIFLGAPGAGKGTQAREISRRLEIPHISTGAIFRDNVQRETPLGTLAKSYMEKGELVRDDVVNTMVRDRLREPDCANGFLLDGFPRTVAQSEALIEMLREGGFQPPVVVILRVSYEIIVTRLSGRRTCPTCQRTYNVRFKPPQHDMVCDSDATQLVQRIDDREEAVRERLRAYDRQTAPLIDFYRSRGPIIELDGERDPEQITAELSRLLETV